jgi:amino acid transporter
MDQLISLIIWIVIFAAVAYCLFWICDRAGFPPPVRWIIGAILLIMVLYFLSGQLGSGPGIGSGFHIRRP